jgi:hypothetical protein
VGDHDVVGNGSGDVVSVVGWQGGWNDGWHGFWHHHCYHGFDF